MVEATVMPPARQVKGAAERRFYSGMAIAMIVIIFLGFAPSFYLPGMIRVPRVAPPLSPVLVLHGVVLTAWMLLFLVQTRLIAGGRRDLHRRLGAAGMVLGIAAAVMMYFATVHQVAEGHGPPFATPLQWASLPLLALPLFALFIGCAWKYRRNAQFHKRFMLLATFIMIEPGLGRLPLFPPTPFGNQISASLTWGLMVIPLMIWDWRSLGRLHTATVLGGGALALMLVVRYLVWETAGWASVAALVLGVQAP